jgi:hypothetical protein
LNCRASSGNKQESGPCGIGRQTVRTEAIMADLTIVYWRDIPAQVIVKKGRQSAKRELPVRFIEAIDMCAMRVGARDSDSYLAEWRRGDRVPVSDYLEAVAYRPLDNIYNEYDRDRLVALVKADGWNNG